MKLNGLRPMIWTREFQQTIDFYESVLGFACGARNDDWGWAALHKDDVEIMVALPNQHIPFNGPAFTGSFYVLTDEVDVLWNGLKDRVKVVYPVENFEWGMREFAIYDNNGYMLQFGQDIGTA